MLLLLVTLQAIALVVLLLLFVRKPPAPSDPRLANLPDEIVALRTRLGTTDEVMRSGFSQQRTAAEDAARALRHELTAGMERVELHLQTFTRQSHSDHALAQEALHGKLSGLGDKNQQSHHDLRESVQAKLADLGRDQVTAHEKLRETVQGRLDKLNQDNAQELEAMRKTVGEKLETTLNERLTASFSHVGEGLAQVNQGIGEMKALSGEVSDLRKVFSNVRARGIVGEFQLGQQLEQIFSREQYEKNVQIKPGSGERVEYALKVPRGSGPDGSETALFPIDSKFPREDWERLEHAYEQGAPEELQKAGAAFERAIRAEGKRICEKYIHEPVTLPHAIMFLPTEGLYAEVMRRPGLQQELQQQCNVTIAGPSTLMAILTSFRMGFHTIALERKGNEIEKVLGKVKTEFNTFGTLLQSVEDKVGQTQNALQRVRSKTTTITRALRGVTELPADERSEAMLAFEELTGVAPQLVASTEE